jgi:hypothetical protein
MNRALMLLLAFAIGLSMILNGFRTLLLVLH